MRVFVLGAGASFHAGYPLARGLGTKVIDWVAQHQDSNAVRRLDVDVFCGLFPVVDDFEEVITELEAQLPRSPAVAAFGDQPRRAMLADLRYSLADFFDHIRPQQAKDYRLFAERVAAPNDLIVTFNYDVSLDRELHLAGKWEIDDGYGFRDCD